MAFLLKPPDMQESPKERASAFGQRLPSKHWIKSASRQSPIEKGHCTKHVIMQGFFWYFLFQTCPAKTLYRYKQSAQRLMILMRMSLAKPESLAHVPWFCALHAWGGQVTLQITPMVQWYWYLFYMDGMGWTLPPTLGPCPFPASSQECKDMIFFKKQLIPYTERWIDVLASWFGFVFFSMEVIGTDSTGDSRMQNHGEDDSRFHTGFR